MDTDAYIHIYIYVLNSKQQNFILQRHSTLFGSVGEFATCLQRKKYYTQPRY